EESHGRDLRKLGLPHGAGKGKQGIKEGLTALRQSIPDLNVEVANVKEEGDTVLFDWTASGTHGGQLMGRAPTKKKISVTGKSRIRVKDGKIIGGSTDWDENDLARQLT